MVSAFVGDLEVDVAPGPGQRLRKRLVVGKRHNLLLGDALGQPEYGGGDSIASTPGHLGSTAR